MWECIALSKQPQKSSWGAVPLVKKIDAFSHSLGQKQTNALQKNALVEKKYQCFDGNVISVS
jgi:hypothetical protein